MSIFDEDINLRNLEIPVLSKRIRTVIDWINSNMSEYYTSVIHDTSIYSILGKYGYDTSLIPEEYVTIVDQWGSIMGSWSNPKFLPNYTTELIATDGIKENLMDVTYKKLLFTFSKLEIVIINGDPYIKCIGNNILHMRYYVDIPDFIKFIGQPTVVVTANTHDNIKQRSDCDIILYDEDYPLDNVAVEPYNLYDKYINKKYHADNDTGPGIRNNGEFIMKVDYSNQMDYGVVQDIYSKTIGGSISSIQV